MIQQFRTLHIFNIFLLLGLALLLRLGLLLDIPQDINTGFREFGSRMLLDHERNLLSPFLNIMLGTLTVFVQALLFNRLINEFGIIGKPTFLPALAYVLCSSFFTPFLFLSPVLICNFLLIYILFRILSATKEPVMIDAAYDMGIVIAIGTILYFPFVTMLLWVWIALFIFRAFNWREWFALVLGYLTIVLFLAVYYYWNDKLSDFYELWKPLAQAFPVFIRINVLDYIVLFPLVLALIIGFFKLRENFYKSYVHVRKAFQLLFVLFVLAVFCFYLKKDFRITHFLLCVIPVATLLAYYFLNATKSWFYESLLVLIMAFVIYFQFV